MEAMLVGLALVAIAIPVAVISLIVGHFKLVRRIEGLELQLATKAGFSAAAKAPMATDPTEPLPKLHAAAQSPQIGAETDARLEAAGSVSSETSPLQDMAPQPPKKPGLGAWLAANWVYVISAASLALAGVFFVQYGIENGLLPPPLRVLAGIGFGLCLVLVAEWMRRRGGDDDAANTAALPSVFAGAGVVSIFAAILAARQLYGLIGPEVAFGGHLMAAALAVGLGWFYGPLLAAVGLLGAFAAPFIVAGSAAPGVWLYGYFGLVAAVGLAIGAVRRWAWLPVLALGLGYAGSALFAVDGGEQAGWIATLVALALFAVILPQLSLIPRHSGPSLLLRGTAWPSPDVMIAFGAAVVSTGFLTFLADSTPSHAMLALAALAALAVVYLLWAEKAVGLADLGLIPTFGFLVTLVVQGLLPARLFVQFAAERAPEVPPLLTVSLILAMAAAISLAFAIRSFRAEPLTIIHSLAAVLAAPVAAAILELFWKPAGALGVYPWALHIMALAAAMVLLALRYARLDGEDRRRVAYATLSALSLIALALFLVVTETALTLALAVLVLVAAGLDRRFRLPEMGLFIQIAAAVLGYRLLADPGVAWAMVAPVPQVLLCYGGVIAGLTLSLWLLRDLDRPITKGVMESAAMGFAAILANLVISRLILGAGSGSDGLTETHWGVTLNGLPWLVLMLIQIYRARLGGKLRALRKILATLAGGLAFAALAAAVGPLNPLFSWVADPHDLVRGVLVFDTLAIAYAMPGAILLAAAVRMPGLGARLRFGFAGLGAGLVAIYVGLEIRRYWQGDDLGDPGVVQGELYSYTVALMLLGAGLLYLAMAKRSARLRRLAMVVIALTVAKVFLLDAAGLTGLTRVVSFLGLGLSLAGLAWLNRWAGKSLSQ